MKSLLSHSFIYLMCQYQMIYLLLSLELVTVILLINDNVCFNVLTTHTSNFVTVFKFQFQLFYFL